MELDTIALTSEGWKKTSMYSIRSDDAWSPTVVVGKADVQRVTSVQIIDGRGIAAPSRV